jgi:hypothetical protein
LNEDFMIATTTTIEPRPIRDYPRIVTDEVIVGANAGATPRI